MKLREFLSARPYIGVISPIAGSLLPMVNALIPLIQFAGLCVGLAVGVITLAIKWTEWKDKRAERRKRAERLARDMYEKEQKALAQKAIKNQNGGNGYTYGTPDSRLEDDQY